MGLETALAIGAGSSVLGGVLQGIEGNQVRQRAKGIAGNGNQDIMAQIQQFLGQQRAGGPDPFGAFLRSNPNALQPYSFDASKAFQMYGAQDKQNLTDALSTLSAGAGSLGARFGTGFADKQAVLQSRFLADQGARNAGIAQSSFYNALQAGMGSFQNAQNQQVGLLNLLLNARNTGVQNQMQALFGTQGQPTAGQIVGQVGGGISQLAFLMPFLKEMQGGAATPVGGQPSAPLTYSSPYNPNYFTPQYQPVSYGGR